MKLFEKLGAKNEAEAFEIVERFTAFASSVAEITGEEDSDASIGKIAAWKQAALSDEQRKEGETAAVESTLAAMTKAKIGNSEALKTVYENDGFAAFVAAADKAKGEHNEATNVIDDLVKSGRLAPAAKSTFENLFQSSGLLALKAAASALPEKAQIKPGPAPEPADDDGLTERERAKADKMNPEEKQRFIALRKARREKEGS